MGLLIPFMCLFWAGSAGAAELPNITVVGTGGTIAGRGQGTTSAGYTAAQVGVAELINELPDLQKIAHIRGVQAMQLASQNMSPDDWLVLARRVQSIVAQPNVDGVVVTHGTDTLEETAYFLDLVVKTDKPIVVVGAMRPVTSLSADGPFNLFEAVLVAGNKQAVGTGVLVLLNDQVHAARDVSKANTSMTDAFKSPEVGALASIEGSRVFFYRKPLRKHTQATAFDIANIATLPRVEIAYGYAGASALCIEAFIKAGVAGIVFAGVGNGNFGSAVDKALVQARTKEILVVRSSRVGSGNVVRNGEIDDDARDYIVSDNLNPQKARVLLMLGLTKTRSAAALQQMFLDY